METINRVHNDASREHVTSSDARNAHMRATALLERSLRDVHSNRTARKYPAPRIAIAIPVCNEHERIIRCVDSLDIQCDQFGGRFAQGVLRVVLLANGCVDGTQRVILNSMERWKIGVTLFDVTLPYKFRNAGAARHLANHAALDMLVDPDGLLFMTDADSCAPSNWVSTYVAMLRSGYDAIAGGVELLQDDSSDELVALAQRGELEDRYTKLLDRMESMIDPVSYDPWPRHFSASGANFAMRIDALAAIGDFPRIACSEDKLLARMLEASGARVRHDCDIRIRTSGRLYGRAKGGMADTLRQRIKIADALCDERLESARSAHFRGRLRRALRDAFDGDTVTKREVIAVLSDFQIREEDVTWGETCESFEKFWERLEREHAQLKRHALRPQRLYAEIGNAQQLLSQIERENARQRLAIPEKLEQFA